MRQNEEEMIQKRENEKISTINLSKYKHIETKVAGALLSNDDGSSRQEAIAELNKGDVLKFTQCNNRGKQSIIFFTPYGKQVGTLLQSIVDDLTFKRDYGLDKDDDYEVEKYFYILSGFAIVREVLKNRTYKCEIDFYYKRG